MGRYSEWPYISPPRVEDSYKCRRGLGEFNRAAILSNAGDGICAESFAVYKAPHRIDRDGMYVGVPLGNAKSVEHRFIDPQAEI